MGYQDITAARQGSQLRQGGYHAVRRLPQVQSRNRRWARSAGQDAGVLVEACARVVAVERPGDRRRRRRARQDQYVTTPQGGLVDDVRSPRSSGSPHLLASDTHHCRVPVRFSNDGELRFGPSNRSSNTSRRVRSVMTSIVAGGSSSPDTSRCSTRRPRRARWSLAPGDASSGLRFRALWNPFVPIGMAAGAWPGGSVGRTSRRARPWPVAPPDVMELRCWRQRGLSDLPPGAAGSRKWDIGVARAEKRAEKTT